MAKRDPIKTARNRIIKSLKDKLIDGCKLLTNASKQWSGTQRTPQEIR
jgi:hypothetical protein